MAKAADGTITPDTDCNALMTAALQAADQAAREPDRLRQRELEQQAVRLWHSPRLAAALQRIVLDIDLRWIQDGTIWGGPFNLDDWLTSRGAGLGHACPALCPCDRTVTASPLSWRACGHQLGPATAAGSGAFLFWPAGLAGRAVSDRTPSRRGGLTIRGFCWQAFDLAQARFRARRPPTILPTIWRRFAV
jgi:hypothetical protein